MVIEFFWWALIVSAVGYFIVMLIITIGWFRIKRFNNQVTSPVVNVSIVVAVRNEEKNIEQLLKNIFSQDYPPENFEVIIIDDHSEDFTRKIIGKFRKDNKVRNIVLGKPEGTGKKTALAHGIELAVGELIITTDGDCEMGEQWLNRMVAFYQQDQPILTIGPVVYNHGKGLLNKFFSLDFLSLVASGAGSAGAGKPMMGNGANLMFNRKAVNEINKNTTGNKFASGDDVFLIHKIVKEKGNGAVQFIKDPQALVYTEAPSTVNAFFKQRIRWASKAKGYRAGWPVIVALAVLFFNLMLVITFAGGFYKSWIFAIFFLFIILKYLFDFPLINEFSNFVNRRPLKRYLPLFELIYPFYIVFVSVISLFFKYEWKGRSGLR